MPALALYDPPLALSNSTTNHEVNVFRVQGDDITRERLRPGAALSSNLDVPVARNGVKDLRRNHIEVFVGKDLRLLLWQDSENRLQCSKPPLQTLKEDIVKEMNRHFGKDTKGLLFDGIAQYAFLRSTPLAMQVSRLMVGRHESIWDEHWANSCWAYRVGTGVTTEVAISSMKSAGDGAEKVLKSDGLLSMFRKQGKEFASNHVPKCWKAVVAGAKELGSGKLSVGKWSDRDGQKLWIFEDRLGYSYIVKSQDGPSWQGNTFYTEIDFADSDRRTKKERPRSAPASHTHSPVVCPSSSVRRSVKCLDLDKTQTPAASSTASTRESKGRTHAARKCYHPVPDYEERLHKVAGVWIVIHDAKLRDSNGKTSDLLQEQDCGWYCRCALSKSKSVEPGEITVLPTRFDVDAERHGFRHGDAITFSIKKFGDDDVACVGTLEYGLFFPRGFHGPFELHGQDGNTVTLSLKIEMKWSTRGIGLVRENLARPKRDNAREVEELRAHQEKIEKDERLAIKQARWKLAESKEVGVEGHTSKVFAKKVAPASTKKKDQVVNSPTRKTMKRSWNKERLNDLAMPKQRECPPPREYPNAYLEMARFQAACAAKGDIVPWGEDYVPDLEQLALPKQRTFCPQESQSEDAFFYNNALDEERLNELAQPKNPPLRVHSYLKKTMIEEALRYGARFEDDYDQTRDRSAVRFGYDDDTIGEQDWSDLPEYSYDATQAYINPLLAHSQSWLNECSQSTDISRAYGEKFGASALRWAQLS